MPDVLGGPVLAWELKRLVRKPIFPFLLVAVFMAYGVWLISVGVTWPSRQSIGTYYDAMPRIKQRVNFEFRQMQLEFEISKEHHAESTRHLVKSTSNLLFAVFLMAILLTPAFVAGAIGHEKENDTLLAMFGTELSERQILIGKLLGRIGFLFRFVIPVIPILVWVHSVLDAPLFPVFMSFTFVLFDVVVIALITMACSILTRSTRDAILGCYAFLILMFLLIIVFFGESSWFRQINPMEVPGYLILPPYLPVPTRVLLTHLILWGSAGVIAWIVCYFTLRPACFRQLEVKALKKSLFPRRRLGDGHPIYWRECHILGIAPVIRLRKLPTWLGASGVFLFSVCLAIFSCMDIYGQNFLPAIYSWQWPKIHLFDTEKVINAIVLHSIILVLAGTIVLIVRSSQCIAEEKRRKTWNDLLLTPLTMSEIIDQKRWGLCRALLPHHMVYLLPMLIFAAILGLQGYVIVFFIGLISFGWFCVVITAGTSCANPEKWEDAKRLR